MSKLQQNSLKTSFWGAAPLHCNRVLFSPCRQLLGQAKLHRHRLPVSCAIVGALCAWIVAAVAGEESARRFARTEVHMGTQVQLVAYASTEELFEQAADRAFRRIAELDRALSDYQSTSELMRLCASAPHEQPVCVSPDLFAVLRQAVLVSEASGGAFDVTIGNVSRLWRRARRQREVPPHDLLQAALTTVDYRQIRVIEPSSVQLLRPGVRIDLGAIAKGYAGDQALQELRNCGITSALINLGGDLVLGEPPPGETGWMVAVAALRRGEPPTEMFVISRCAVATSGDLWQYFEFNGRRYSHILDPRTGWGVEGPRSVTVVAKSGAIADALATAVSVVGPDEGLKLASHFHAAVLFMTQVDDAVRIIRSPTFPHLPANE